VFYINPSRRGPAVPAGGPRDWGPQEASLGLPGSPGPPLPREGYQPPPAGTAGGSPPLPGEGGSRSPGAAAAPFGGRGSTCDKLKGLSDFNGEPKS